MQRARQETTLVIGDAHNAPKQNLRRFDALNRWIKRERPSRIVIIGDWVDMPSLSRFDVTGSKALEGTRIAADIAVGVEAFERLVTGLGSLPVIFCEGNHEERIKRMEEEHPKLEGSFLTLERLLGRRCLYLPYREYWTAPDGLAFTHVPHNGEKPIASTTGARKVLASSAGSVVWGHTHQLDFATAKRNGGPQIYGLNVGCFIEPRDDPGYMLGRIKDWWRGVVLIRHGVKGPWLGEFETVSLQRLLGTGLAHRSG